MEKTVRQLSSPFSNFREHRTIETVEVATG